MEANGFNLIHEKRDETGIGGEKKWVETILKRPKNKPFFLWYASHDAHRSWGENEFSGIHNPEEIIPPEYLIDDLATRQDLANYYDEIILVFGCGGDRDKSKRSKMMKIAQDFASKIFFTSDNNRYEPFSSIVKDAMAGNSYTSIKILEDRKVAINLAVQCLNKENILVILGKGHET